MIMRLVFVFLGLLLLVGKGAPALAESKKAASLRQAHALIAFTPRERFLASNFVTSEMDPPFIFGTVKAFAAARKFPTTWLIEADEKNRFTYGDNPDKPGEYFIYLEEDRPDKVVYYVFADQSGVPPEQWIDWRRFFYKSATEAQYAPVKAKLEQALKEGFGGGAELSFIQEDGKSLTKPPQEVLLHDLRFAPIYDLSRQQKIGQ